MITPASRSIFATAAIAWLTAVALAVVLFRAGPMIGFDPFFYCELGKQYTTSWPHAFGNHWPCGLPLAAGLLGRIGIPAYVALCLIALTAVAVLALLSSRLLTGGKFALLAVVSLVAMPEVGVQIFGALSELPFAACWLGLGVALAGSPKPRAFWLAGLCVVLGLGVRYVGVLGVGVIWCWLLWEARALIAARAFVPALLATVTASATAGGLLLWNIVATGHISGADRGDTALLGLGALPIHFAQFGWSAPSAFMLGGLRDAAGADRAPGLLIGAALTLTGGAICLWAWLRPARPWTRPVAFVAFVYGAGMIFLRTIGTFDALYNARTFLPVFFPLTLVLIGQFSVRSPRWVALVCGAVLLSGVASAARGLSRQTGGDVRPAVAVLRPLLRPDDIIQINSRAYSLATCVRNRTPQVWLEYWDDAKARRFLVIVAKPLDRRGTRREIEPGWLELAQRLVASGQHRWLLQTDAVLVLECLNPSPEPVPLLR